MVRREDLLPVYATDSFIERSGLNLRMLQEDIRNIGLNMADPEDEKRLWKKYEQWDGKEPLEESVKWNTGKWLLLGFRRTEDGVYDLMSVYEITQLHEDSAIRRSSGCSRRSKSVQDKFPVPDVP